jgi:hypothetical protein
MVSGLKGKTYEERLKELDMTTPEERRHQLDMIQTFKIIGGHDAMEKECWFSMATNSSVHKTGNRSVKSTETKGKSGGERELF